MLLISDGQLGNAIWIFAIFAFGLSGAAMLVFAQPFDDFSHRHPGWTRGGPHSARFYRVMGTIWLLIAFLLAIPVILILAYVNHIRV